VDLEEGDMRSIRRLRGAAAITGSLLVLALAVAVLLASVTMPRAKSAEAIDLASMLLLLQSMQPAATNPALDNQQTSPQTAAGSDVFLKIEGIPGESADHRHGGEIEILSFSWGASASHAGGGGGGAGKVQMQDFQLVTRTSAASPLIFLATVSGQHIPSAVLTVRKAGGEQQEYMTITLRDVVISSYQQSSGGDVVPTDQISLNFSRIEFEYRPQNPDGSLGSPVKAGWDLKANKKV
jgi:type VI secretion system secreted protein Hcp